ncbi:glycosyltransferase family 2 protein [Planktothrix sp. FACHB-1355]|uniref:Glycosyltransferase family 2 protein n=1 Tax=Aerosakkonema funiforme FACHB-1375 TaxID=2949571 RepID=A0A926VII5_9CYAN|nr:MULTISPECIES: hormogonium polysaccharide biosynthesis glycosyltransferase HpsE [Oscillatoriales]MBD2184531.1 glycosyltransferase family 2 protein [Aerosakkonema funiforme FACHB-1375]MBD3561188.1 glycosyltransferase family 2 protein [Planktothrix sp. FACHB-1355]
MSVDFTVAIPTYNGEKRLPEVLERLRECIAHAERSQSIQNFRWEIIVVDNNSKDNTAKLVRDYQVSWPLDYPLKYCFEGQQGAGFARKRAIEEAQAELIGFLDDDNLPASNWVEAACTFGLAHPQAGAYGSQIHGLFEIPPPENLKPLLPYLAIVERGSEPLLYKRSKKLLPPSAGLVVRKQAWLESVPSQLILTGRVDSNMLTGEDLEMLSYIQNRGWEIWYNPAMEIEHKIPHWRLQKQYLIPFFRGIGLSRYVTRMLSVVSWQRPLAFVGYMANDLRKIILHLLKYRNRIKSDLVAACQMELLLSSFLSFFYLWNNGYLSNKNKE